MSPVIVTLLCLPFGIIIETDVRSIFFKFENCRIYSSSTFSISYSDSLYEEEFPLGLTINPFNSSLRAATCILSGANIDNTSRSFNAFLYFVCFIKIKVLFYIFGFSSLSSASVAYFQKELNQEWEEQHQDFLRLIRELRQSFLSYAKYRLETTIWDIDQYNDDREKEMFGNCDIQTSLKPVLKSGYIFD